MSIPLVQKAEKDDINTSIIAIKRNIERINMLLGLSNSEEIDTSVFATKEELEALEPVDEVAVDNMHSVTSNAVAESLSYSTTEQKTGGYWIDGKPIYRKVLTGTITGTAYTVAHNIPNIDSICRFEPYLWAGASYISFNAEGYYFTIIAGKAELSIRAHSGYVGGAYTLILEYTKTTD